MTEEEWLVSTDPTRLLTYAAAEVSCQEYIGTGCGFLSLRKTRLFIVGCCRCRWDLIDDLDCREAINTVERIADGLAEEYLLGEHKRRIHEARLASEKPLQCYLSSRACFEGGTLRQLRRPRFGEYEWPKDIYATFVPWDVALLRASLSNPSLLSQDRHRVELDSGFQAEQAIQASRLRCVVGNPFRPIAFDPAWRTSTAVGLAQSMYVGRDFAAMPILADALQDAGCEDETILAHCRDPQQVHVRGCWVVDLVLGKQ